MKTLLVNGKIVSGSGTRTGDILIDNEKIEKVADHIAPEAGWNVVDCEGRFVFPGFIDTHTHLDMFAGAVHTADTFATGTRAAICGGTTTVLDFATQEKDQTLLDAFSTWTDLAEGKSSCDFGFHMAITNWNGNVQAELPEMTKVGVTSYKLYMAYDNLRVTDAEIFEVLRAVKEQGGIVGMHCENGDLVNEMTKQLLLEHKVDPSSHPLSRPPVVEAEAITRYLAIAQLVDTPVNIVHLSTKWGLQVITDARARGQKVYVETCPQYLLLTDEKYRLPDFESGKYVLSPPLRASENSEALWQAVEDGRVDTIGSDHCSFLFHGQKTIGTDNFSKIPNGAPGVDVRAELLYTYGVDEKKISPERFCALVSENAARLFGMYPTKGAIAPGSDADIVLWENEEWTLTDDNQHTAADYTPFAGFRIAGKPKQVYLRGALVVEDGEITKENLGRYVPRKPCAFWR